MRNTISNNVEGNNNKNQVILKNLSEGDFFTIREIFISGQKRLRSTEEKKRSSDAWLKIEKAWYESLPIKGEI